MTLTNGTTAAVTSNDSPVTVLTAPTGEVFANGQVINESGAAGFIILDGNTANPIRLPAGPASVAVPGPFGILAIQRIASGTNLSTIFAYGQV